MTGSLIARERLGDDQRRRMLQILRAHFRHVTEARFDHDLSEKNWVILIQNEAAHIVGFSTLLLYEAEFEGSPIAVVYSGDTIIEREAWGSAALPRTWIQSVWQLHQAQCPRLPLYWLLLTSGFRTYRFLSVFWREFFPCYCAPTPPRLQRLLEQLARDRFGALLDLAAGVVHLGQPLCDDLLAIPASKMHEPHVDFFARRNPGYVQGDELICVAELTRENLTPAGWRMVDGPAGAFSRI